MIRQDKTDVKVISISKKNKNIKKVIGAMRGLKQPKMTKSNLYRKNSNSESRNKRVKKSKKPKKKICYKNAGEDSGLKRSENHTSKKNLAANFCKNDLSKGNQRSKLNKCSGPGSNLQRPNIEKASLLNTIFKHSKDFIKSSSSSQIFVSLSNTEEDERHKNKFRKPATGRKLRRLRKDLWQKSSYHQRFLRKSNTVISQESPKPQNKEVKSKRKIKRMPAGKKDLNLPKSVVKNPSNDKCKARNESTGKKNPEKHTIPNKPPSRDGLEIKKETEINTELPRLVPNKPPKEDVSTIDESYMKSLLLIANGNTKSENVESKDLDQKSHNSEPETGNKLKATGQEFYVRKTKIKKTLENKTDYMSFTDSNNMKPKENNDLAKLPRDAIKSEMQIKLWKRKLADVKNKEIKHMPKSYSKHEIKNNQQKQKTRNIMKNKTQNTIDAPFHCEVQKTNEVRELWKKENFKIPESCDSSLTLAESVNDENQKRLGLESYQTLKNFVEEELHRIAHMSENTGIQEKDMSKQNAVSNERQLSELVRKKLAAKSGESFLDDEILHSTNTLVTGKAEKIKSKLKLLDENNKSIKVVPDEVIRNWSIVNRLEQAFLALGTPDFRKVNEKKLGTTNTTTARTIQRTTPERKRVDNKIKDAEKSEKKSAAQTIVNKQKATELNKPVVTEKQPNTLRKKELTKPYTPLSISYKKSTKVDRRIKPKEQTTPSQRVGSCKPCIKPTVKAANKTLFKPTTPVQNLCSERERKELLNVRQNGTFGKKNSSRNLLCESTSQNVTDDDSLERKKTFPIISLKHSITVQPRRSKSSNKIDGSFDLVEKNGLPSAGNQECEKLNFIDQQELNQDIFDHFKDIEYEKELKIDDLGDLKSSSLAKIVQIFGRPGNSSVIPGGLKITSWMRTSFNEADQVKKLTESTPPVRDKSDEKKVRPIKERSILSIRSNQHENQTPSTNIFQIKEEIDNLRLFIADVRRCDVKMDVFLTPTNVSSSQTSWTSTEVYDVTESESSVENCEQITTSDNIGRKNISMIFFQTVSETTDKTKIKNALWEKDIRYYRALVKEIMNQHKRLGGFLKQSERSSLENPQALKMLTEEEGEVDILNKQTNLKEYREKIKQAYQEVPILEYKRQMQEIYGKLYKKQRNLPVVKASNAEVDLDVKDYEPTMKMISGSRLYFENENVIKTQGTNTNLRGEKISLHDVISCKYKKPGNFPKVISTPRSCVILSKKTGPSQRVPEEKCPESE